MIGLPALVRQLARGHIVHEWADAVEERAVFVRPIAGYAGTWQREEEAEEVRAAPIVPVVVRTWSPWGRMEEDITAYLREHGESYATMVGRAVHPKNTQSVRVRLCSMWAEGKVIRTGRGRYRLA